MENDADSRQPLCSFLFALDVVGRFCDSGVSGQQLQCYLAPEEEEMVNGVAVAVAVVVTAAQSSRPKKGKIDTAVVAKASSRVLSFFNYSYKHQILPHSLSEWTKKC